MKKPSVYTIVLNWNKAQLLIETISFLEKQDYENHHIVVVDNNSSDDSIEQTKSCYPAIPCIILNDNLGWTGGNNAGIQFALNQNADIILLCNNDIIIDDTNVISTIVDTFEEDKQFGIVSPLIYAVTPKTKFLTAGWNHFENKKKSTYVFNKYRQQSTTTLPTHLTRYDAVSGCFMAVKAEVFKENGLLDDNFYMYSDDVEYCFRAWTTNYLCIANNLIKVHHYGSASSVKGSPFKLYYQTRNYLYFLSKHKKNINHFNFFFKSHSLAVLKLFYRIAWNRKYFSGNLFQLYRNYFRAIKDYRMRKMGKRLY